MLTFGFPADGLLPQRGSKNELDKYCRLEGMDYLHLASESRNQKSLLGKIRYSKKDPAHDRRN